MKRIFKLNIIIILVVATHCVHAQICQSELNINSTTPNAFFTDNNNGTISDIGTGLMWQKCQQGLLGSGCDNGAITHYTWEGAINESASSSLAGYNDWRLPSHKELLSIVEHRCNNPSINSIFFPNTSSSEFWSSSPSTNYSNRAWYIEFTNGESDYYNNLRTSSLSVRLVRSE